MIARLGRRLLWVLLPAGMAIVGGYVATRCADSVTSEPHTDAEW